MIRETLIKNISYKLARARHLIAPFMYDDNAHSHQDSPDLKGIKTNLTCQSITTSTQIEELPRALSGTLHRSIPARSLAVILTYVRILV